MNVGFGLFASFRISNGHALALGRSPLSDLQFSGQAGRGPTVFVHCARAGYGPVASARPCLFRTNVGYGPFASFRLLRPKDLQKGTTG